MKYALVLLLAGCAAAPVPPEQAKALADYDRHRAECNAVTVSHPGDAHKAITDCMAAKGHK